MNWDRGLKRIILILSIIGAVLGAAFFYWDVHKTIQRKKEYLYASTEDEYCKALDEQPLIDEWRRKKTGIEQLWLWKIWTFDILPKSSRTPLSGPPLTEDNLAKTSRKTLEIFYLRGLGDLYVGPYTKAWEQLHPVVEVTAEEATQLKERGWQTSKGVLLPLTPEDVWNRMQCLIIRNFEHEVRLGEKDLPIAMSTGAFFGFCAVWVFYAASKWGAWPLYKWISVGFREDKQKGLKKTNESGPAGDC